MDIIHLLTANDHTAAYNLLLALEATSAESNQFYPCFDAFLGLLSHPNAYVRTRGFRLCCAQARWDLEGKLDAHLPELLAVLPNAKPTALRQALTALTNVVHYQPALGSRVEETLSGLDLSQYKDSMRPLLQQDIARLRNQIHSLLPSKNREQIR